MHKVLVNPLGGLSLPKKSVVMLTDHPDLTLDVHRGSKTTQQQLYPVCMKGFPYGSVCTISQFLLSHKVILLHQICCKF